MSTQIDRLRSRTRAQGLIAVAAVSIALVSLGAAHQTGGYGSSMMGGYRYKHDAAYLHLS